MIYEYSDLIKKVGGYYQLNIALKNKKIFKISRGLYTDENDFVDELTAFFKSYPNSVLTLECAFAFYEFTDYVPERYQIATSQKAHKIENNKVEQIYISDEYLNIGKTTINSNWGVINIYDKERMLIELFRFEHRLGSDFFKEVVNSYRKATINDEIDFNKLSRYCSLFKRGRNIFKKIFEVIV